MNDDIKREMLRAVYAAHGEWADAKSFACVKGCAHCCTQSVTMTSLEGEMILARCDKEGSRQDFFDGIARNKYSGTKPQYTTNQFARLCLEGRETVLGEMSWRLTPCPFLRDNCCTIYPVRPFGCRSFGSVVNCAEQGSAEVEPVVVTINTVLMQIIEHIDQGRQWGNMLDILYLLGREGNAASSATNGGHRGLKAELPVSEPIPGFLVPPEEEHQVRHLMDALYSREIFGRTFQSWLL